MKACNVKKADTFLVTRIPSWKLFSRLEHLCIKRAILEWFLSRHRRHFVAGFGIIYLAQRNRGIPMYMSPPINESSIPNLARALQQLIQFQTVNSLPSRNWIKARFSITTKAPAKRLIQAYTSPKNRITEEIPGTPPYLCMQAKLKVME